MPEAFCLMANVISNAWKDVIMVQGTPCVTFWCRQICGCSACRVQPPSSMFHGESRHPTMPDTSLLYSRVLAVVVSNLRSRKGMSVLTSVMGKNGCHAESRSVQELQHDDIRRPIAYCMTRQTTPASRPQSCTWICPPTIFCRIMSAIGSYGLRYKTLCPIRNDNH
jgi:hypothetical protein